MVVLEPPELEDVFPAVEGEASVLSLGFGVSPLQPLPRKTEKTSTPTKAVGAALKVTNESGVDVRIGSQNTRPCQRLIEVEGGSVRKRAAMMSAFQQGGHLAGRQNDLLLSWFSKRSFPLSRTSRRLVDSMSVRISTSTCLAWTARRICGVVSRGARRALIVSTVAVGMCATSMALSFSENSSFAEMTPGVLRRVRADFRILNTRPPAVRGEPMLLPVRFEGAAPTSVEILVRSPDVVRLDAAASAEGTLRLRADVLWPVRIRTTSTGRWAQSASPLILEGKRPEGASDAYIAITLPNEIPAGATMFVDGERIEPTWCDRAASDVLTRIAARASMLFPQSQPDALLSRPDPALPFERFRFAIGEVLRGWSPPPALEESFDAPNALAARASNALWLAGLARIAATSEGTAAEVAELLVATATDPAANAPIAAWIADPAELSALLSLALDPARNEQAMVEAVVTWLRVRSPLLLWIEEESRDEVVVVIANPSSGDEVIRLEWMSDAGLVDSEPPVATIVPPTESLRMRMPRPRGAEIDGVAIPNGGVDVLRIENRGQVRSIPVTPATVASRPMGLTIGSFVAPLNLPAVAVGARTSTTLAPAATVSLRPRLAGWEVLIECRGSTDSTTASADRVEIVGPGGAMISIARDGTVDDVTGALFETAGAAVRVFADRWRIALPVPPAWIDRSGPQTIVTLGFRRRIGTSTDFATFDAPFASTPWTAVPRTISVDIHASE